MTNTDHAYQNAAAWTDTILEYAEAMNQETWDRLEELRDERNSCADTAYPMDGDDLAELERLEKLETEYQNAEHARELAEESPLYIELSGTWTPGETPQADGFIILLSTGGPALRIVGELNDYMEPSRAWIEYQDWGTPWTEYHGDNSDQDALLDYCRVFYFGE